MAINTRDNPIDLSLVIPSIRPEKINRLIDSIPAAIGEYTYEIILVGNYQPNFDCLYLEDLGSPSRCVQRGAAEAKGKFMKWSTDDGIYNPNSLKDILDIAYTMDEKDGIIAKYTEEGPANWITGADDQYYTAWTHADQRIAGIPEDFKIAPVAVYNTEYFKAIGGLDCQFEHINMNTHDLAFRVQKNGGTFRFSPAVVMHCDSRNFNSDEHIPLDSAYQLNDLPKFMALYDSIDGAKGRIVIDYNTWQDSPSPWRRFE